VRLMRFFDCFRTKDGSGSPFQSKRALALSYESPFIELLPTPMRLALLRLAGLSSTDLFSASRNSLGRCRQVHNHTSVYRPVGIGYYDASKIAMAKQWKAVREDRNKRRKVESGAVPIIEGSHEEILQIEAAELIAKSQVKSPSEEINSDDGVSELRNSNSPFPPGLESLKANPPANAADKEVKDREIKASGHATDELELKILELSSTGDGLAISKDRQEVYVVPFAVPGDKVLAKVFPQVKRGPYTHTDFIKVLEPSPDRDNSLVKCKYFEKCAGCQFQMLPYESQLAHKKTIVEKAFRNFSGLNSSQIPPIGDTIGSPLQYGYRTKLSPHFDGPPRSTRKFTEVPLIGFTAKGRKKVMDIESCPIGTDILQEGLTSERAKVARDYRKYKNGATILLRESTERTLSQASTPGNEQTIEHETVDESTTPATKELTTTSTGAPLLLLKTPTHTDAKTCITDNNGFSTEYISSFKFTSRAGSFFQNNNSILPRFTSFVRTHAFPPILDPHDPPIKYMLDAYCGSGLFAVTLSSLFTSVLGIDIDPKGVEAARINAQENAIPNAGFIEADASALFADVPFPPAQTLVVIDPPRKGASEDFLQQLMRFGPKRVIYVSCNVHTQARDIGILVNGAKGMEGWCYEIESLRGFDFFPQTGHVEGVAFLNRVERVI
jgi:tRNA (uracil-5-)-methyltransferase